MWLLRDPLAARNDAASHHPIIGRRVEGELRELVILRGASGYVALYRFDRVRDIVRPMRIRHQREVDYRD